MGSHFTPNCKLLTPKLLFVRIILLLKTQKVLKVAKWWPVSVFLEEVLYCLGSNFSSIRTPICSRINSKRFSIKTSICSKSHLFESRLYADCTAWGEQNISGGVQSHILSAPLLLRPGPKGLKVHFVRFHKSFREIVGCTITFYHRSGVT